MKNSFAEELILAYNSKLDANDLENLSKLSNYFDVFSVIDKVFTKDFCTIVNYLVLNELPYMIASKLMFNGKLENNFLEYKNGKFFLLGELFGRMIVYKYVDIVNYLLQDEC